MTTLELILLSLAGILTSSLTAVVGYGGGTILIALLLVFMPPVAAIPFHGLVQLVSNLWRGFLFRHHIAWPLIWRYLLLLPFGILVGYWFFRGLGKEAIQLLIGFFILSTLFTRRLKRFRNSDLPLWGFYPLGFISGVLNMIVGAVAPLLGVLTVRKELAKESLIATLACFALTGHVLKVAAFTYEGFDYITYALPFMVMVPSVMIGGLFGKWLLSHFSETLFQKVFYLVLLLLSFKLIVWEGLIPLVLTS